MLLKANSFFIQVNEKTNYGLKVYCISQRALMVDGFGDACSGVIVIMLTVFTTSPHTKSEHSGAFNELLVLSKSLWCRCVVVTHGAVRYSRDHASVAYGGAE